VPGEPWLSSPHEPTPLTYAPPAADESVVTCADPDRLPDSASTTTAGGGRVAEDVDEADEPDEEPEEPDDDVEDEVEPAAEGGGGAKGEGGEGGLAGAGRLAPVRCGRWRARPRPAERPDPPRRGGDRQHHQDGDRDHAGTGGDPPIPTGPPRRVRLRSRHREGVVPRIVGGGGRAPAPAERPPPAPAGTHPSPSMPDPSRLPPRAPNAGPPVRPLATP